MKYLSILFSLALFVTCSSTDGLALRGATTDVRIVGNLDAGANGWAITGVAGGLPAFMTFNSLNSATDFQVPVSIFDSLGGSHPINLYFFRDNTAPVSAKVATTWVVRAYIDGSELQAVTPSIAGIPIQVGSDATITFGPNGQQVSPASGSVVLKNAGPAGSRHWGNGSPGGSIDYTLELTSFDNKSLVDFLDVQPESCILDEARLEASFDSVVRYVSAEWLSCSISPDSFAVSAGQLAERAVAVKKCDIRAFVSEASCRRCFDGAASLLRKDYNKRLYRGLFAQANRSVARRKDLFCSSKAFQTRP